MDQGQVFKLLYKKNKQQPTTTKHVFLKNPLEIDFFLQVAQFIFEILGGILQYTKGTGDNGKKNGKKDFTLPLCIRVLLHAKWSCRTMTREGSGWAERRWVDLSRSFGVCRCRSSLGIPIKTAAWRNYYLLKPGTIVKFWSAWHQEKQF